MKLPGEACLDFRVEPNGEAACTLRQTALFEPLGLLGLLYSLPILPFYTVVFRSLLTGISAPRDGGRRRRAADPITLTRRRTSSPRSSRQYGPHSDTSTSDSTNRRRISASSGRGSRHGRGTVVESQRERLEQTLALTNGACTLVGLAFGLAGSAIAICTARPAETRAVICVDHHPAQVMGLSHGGHHDEKATACATQGECRAPLALLAVVVFALMTRSVPGVVGQIISPSVSPVLRPYRKTRADDGDHRRTSRRWRHGWWRQCRRYRRTLATSHKRLSADAFSLLAPSVHHRGHGYPMHQHRRGDDGQRETDDLVPELAR